VDLQMQGKVILLSGFNENEIAAAIVQGCAAEGAIPVTVRPGGTAQDTQRVVEQTVDRFGRIDALVNHAGWDDETSLEHSSPQQYISCLQRSLLPHYSVAHSALPYLKSSRGPIINLVSTPRSITERCLSGYESLKGAILALTREWAVELLQDGIRVNAIVWRTFGDHPTTVASTILFLLSDKSGHITGECLASNHGAGRQG
jgi:L-fucose dehydrogenase